MVQNIGDASLYLLRAGIGAVAPQVEQGAGAALGTAINPHATLVFDGVDLKIHSFEWQFAPKSYTEQNTLDKIVNLIKYHIHPEYDNPLSLEGGVGLASVNRGLLRYPSLVEVSLVGVNKQSQFGVMFKHKKLMMINQFNVDFTPTGNVELNRGGTPVMTRCSMNLTESTIHTRQDYMTTDAAVLQALNDETGANQAAATGDTTESLDNPNVPPNPSSGPPANDPLPEDTYDNGSSGDGVNEEIQEELRNGTTKGPDDGFRGETPEVDNGTLTKPNPNLQPPIWV